MSVGRIFKVKSKASITSRDSAETVSLFNGSGAPYGIGDLPVTAIVTASAIGTVGKTTTQAEPTANTFVAVKFTNGNSATSPTLAFAGGSARALQLGGTASAAAKLAVAANGVALFFFDGTVLHQIGAYT